MKVLLVSSSNGDYGACTFEDNTTPEKRKEWWDKVAGNGKGMRHTMLAEEIENEQFDMTAYEFGEVDEGFIRLMRDIQDYDDSKHENWFIIE